MAVIYTTIVPQVRLELCFDENNLIGTPSFQLVADGAEAVTVYAPTAGATSRELLAAAVKAFNETFNGPAQVAKLEAAE